MASAARRIITLAFALSASLAAAAPRALDQTRIHASYHDGDFEKVIKELEAYQKSGRKCAPSESLFIEKYLAVVYAANPGTRELGRYHMFRMLDLAPGADLLDMFVGEEVDAVFEKVRKEHSLRSVAAKAAAPAASTREAAPAAAQSPIRNAAAWPSDARANSAKPIPRSVAPPKAAWESAAYDSPARPAGKRSAWDDVGGLSQNANPAAVRPAAGGAARSGNVSAAGMQTPAASGANPFAAGPRDDGMRFHSDEPPAWKEPGLWIGGGAALAVVAITLFYSGSSPAPEPKTYVVPATAAR